jgi:hypothetical protein
MDRLRTSGAKIAVYQHPGRKRYFHKLHVCTAERVGGYNRQYVRVSLEQPHTLDIAQFAKGSTFFGGLERIPNAILQLDNE